MYEQIKNTAGGKTVLLRKTPIETPGFGEDPRYRVALVCDWLTGMRGGERCLLAVCDLFPRADIFTLFYFPDRFTGQFADHQIHTSFLQKLPVGPRSYRALLPLFGRAVESFDFHGYDLVLSFSHCVAKGVIVPPAVPHVCYCHTPARYAWDQKDTYLEGMGFFKKKIASYLLGRLKTWDQKTSNRVDYFIANSRNTRSKIRSFYGRDCRVIHPPVDLHRFQVSHRSEDYYLLLSAWVPYKRVDLAIRAFNQNGKRLLVAGRGPEYKRLKKIAGKNIKFICDPDDRTAEQLYAGCRALIFPGSEDFGIVPLEAQACGKPVIAYGRGGALETVIARDVSEMQPTGLFFQDPTPECLCEAVRRFELIEDLFHPEACRANAARFSTQRYQAEMLSVIDQVMNSRQADKSPSSHLSGQSPCPLFEPSAESK